MCWIHLESTHFLFCVQNGLIFAPFFNWVEMKIFIIEIRYLFNFNNRFWCYNKYVIMLMYNNNICKRAELIAQTQWRSILKPIGSRMSSPSNWYVSQSLFNYFDVRSHECYLLTEISLVRISSIPRIEFQAKYLVSYMRRIEDIWGDMIECIIKLVPQPSFNTTLFPGWNTSWV